jgi:hypothetical protein
MTPGGTKSVLVAAVKAFRRCSNGIVGSRPQPASAKVALMGGNRAGSEAAAKNVGSRVAVSAAARRFDHQQVVWLHVDRVASGEVDDAAVGALHAIGSQRAG